MLQLLIIEDDDAHMEIAKSHIMKQSSIEEIKLYAAKNLTEGKEYIKNGIKINCIFLDLCLPESDGIETVKEVLNYIKEQKKNIPVIVYTGVEDYKIAKEAFKLGIKGFIIKGDSDEKEIKRAISYTSYSSFLPEKQCV
tara:strand:- start:679 stop:1095 length:417 start_codon:yes stop_codon:yes gene_type:complete